MKLSPLSPENTHSSWTEDELDGINLENFLSSNLCRFINDDTKSAETIVVVAAETVSKLIVLVRLRTEQVSILKEIQQRENSIAIRDVEIASTIDSEYSVN